MHAGRARGREQRPEVRLGHLDAVLQFTSTFCERPRAPLGLRSHLPVLPGLFTGGLQLSSEQGDLLAELHEPIHRGPAQVRVREAATTTGPRVLLPLPGAPSLALDRLSLARGDRRSVEETIGAPRGLQSAARDKRSDCASDRQWIREPQFPAKLGWRGFQQFALLGAVRDSGEESIDALEALLVHGQILHDCQPIAPVVRKRIHGSR